MTSVVYFAQTASGAIKIGWTADLDRRIRNIRCSTHEQVEIMATLPGDATLEGHFHNQFSEDRIQGEWFRPSPELANLIDSVKAGAYRPPAGYAPERSSGQRFDLGRSCRAALDEARSLVEVIAGPRAMGEKVKSGLCRVSMVTGLGERRIRAIWHREARSIAAEEMDRLREVAALRPSHPGADRPPAGGLGRGHDGAGGADRSVDRGAGR